MSIIWGTVAGASSLLLLFMGGQLLLVSSLLQQERVMELTQLDLLAKQLVVMTQRIAASRLPMVGPG